jgi:hypothetical protein
VGGELRVIATGGLGKTMAGLTAVFDSIDPDLTLDGLAYVAEYVTAKAYKPGFPKCIVITMLKA